MRAKFVRVPKPAEPARSLVKNLSSLWVISYNGDPVCCLMDAESIPGTLEVISDRFSVAKEHLRVTNTPIVD